MAKKPKKKKQSVKSVRRVSFMRKRKTPADKFSDIYRAETSTKLKEQPDGKLKVPYKIRRKLADQLGISTHELTRLQKFGFEKENIFSKSAKYTPNEKRKLSAKFTRVKNKVSKLHKRKKKVFNEKTGKKVSVPEFSNMKEVSKDITPEEFSLELFPAMKKLKRRKKRQQFYFRVGLYMVFKNGYIIDNLPISHYDFKGYPAGYKRMFEKVYGVVNEPHREVSKLLFFRFNYFDVSIIDL